MNYQKEIIIHLPVQRVVELFDDPKNLYEWMEGLTSFEHLEGTIGEPGAKSKLVFQMGKRRVEMIETITVRDLPKEFSGIYEAKGVYNVVKNHFVAVDERHTKYITDQEFRFSGFMKIIALLFSGAFKKQTLKHMEAFKRFAESKGKA